MDRAYQGNQTRQRALALGFTAAVLPCLCLTADRFSRQALSTRVAPWEYDKEMEKRRNKVECLFRRLKDFRPIFSRFEKLDVIFPGFLSLALIYEALH